MSNDKSSLAGAQLQAKRVKRLRNCETCGKPFVGIKTKRYCSHNCTQVAYMQRKKAKEQS